MSMQMAELHYVSGPSYDAASIAERAESLIESGIETRERKGQSDVLLFFHTRHPVQYKDGAAPAQTAILSLDKRGDPAGYADTIQQSWACDDANDRIQACTTCRLVTEMMARMLEPADRLRLFHGVLQAVIETTKPHAIVFTHSQQVIAPDAYLASCDKPPIHRPGSLNVRFFRIANSDTNDMIMDTRGLDEIGLHDLQCHFRDLDPNDVAGVLYNTAIHIAENGPVVESGHTVAGTTPGSKWQCQFENSLLDPKRELLDLNPGPPYAAGNR
jgi:hypothetical protein